MLVPPVLLILRCWHFVLSTLPGYQLYEARLTSVDAGVAGWQNTFNELLSIQVLLTLDLHHVCPLSSPTWLCFFLSVYQPSKEVRVRVRYIRFAYLLSTADPIAIFHGRPSFILDRPLSAVPEPSVGSSLRIEQGPSWLETQQPASNLRNSWYTRVFMIIVYFASYLNSLSRVFFFGTPLGEPSLPVASEALWSTGKCDRTSFLRKRLGYSGPLQYEF
jgi:hypothetical protein